MLEAHDLAGARGRARLFSGVGIRVETGRALAVTGANGSGTTALLRILAGLTAPVAGTVRLDGAAMMPFDPRLREAVVFGGHLPALKDELTARENLESLVALAGAEVEPTAIDDALDRVALSKRQSLPARVLPQGQRRRIPLAASSLSRGPRGLLPLARFPLRRKPLWICDEPATALDKDGLALFTTMLAEHLDRGGMAVVATAQRIG